MSYSIQFCLSIFIMNWITTIVIEWTESETICEPSDSRI